MTVWLLLDSVCQPYRIVTDPKPQLSLFLNVDTLLAWYSSPEDAMVGVVGNCVTVWKDDKEDQQADKYVQTPIVGKD